MFSADASETSDTIRVCCRFRPVNKRELEEEAHMRAEGSLPELLKFDSDSKGCQTNDGKKEDAFRLDRVFSGGATRQEEVYEYVARPTIEDVIRGYNGTIFAYGQTGSGKTFSMFGADSEEPALAGIIPRSCQHIFEHIEATPDGTEFIVKCSFLEIYKETIRDLLNPQGVSLKVRETPSRGVWVEDLSEHYVQSQEQVLELIKLGEKFRQVTSTDMNQVSSRSHSLFILILHQKLPDGSTKMGRLNLADLAGSEKVGKTNAVGNTLEEAKKINQSLSALGNCISAITKGLKHIPYRDSKLSFILRESLGGNTKTTLLVCCSPHRFNIDETVGTLRFAQRAKTIKNNATINQKRSIEELEAIVAKLTEEINRLTRYISVLERELSTANPAISIATLRQSSIPSSPASNSSSASRVSGWVSSSPSNTGSSSSSSSQVSSLLGSDETLISLKVKYDRLKADLDSQIQQLNEEVESSVSEKSSLEQQVGLVSQQLEQQQQRLAEAGHRADVALEERNQARLDLKSARLEIEALHEASKIAQKRYQALEQDAASLAQQSDSFSRLNKRLEEAQANHAKAEHDLHALQLEFDLLKLSLNAADAEKQELQQKLAHYQANEAALATLRGEVAEAKVRMDDLQRQNGRLKQQCEEVKAALDEKDARLLAANEAVSSEKALRVTAEQSAKMKSVQLEKTASDLEEARTSQEALRGELYRTATASQSLTDKIGEQQRIIDSLEKLQREAKDKVKETESELTRITAQHREVQRASRNQISSLQAQREDLDQRLGLVAKQKTDAEAALKVARSDLEEAQQSLSQLQLQHQRLMGAKDGMALQHTQQLHHKQIELQEAQQRASELQSQVVELQGRLQKNRDRVDQLNKDRASLSTQVSELLERAAAEAKGASEKVCALSESLSSSEAQLAASNQALQEVTLRNEGLTTLLQQAEQQAAEQSQQRREQLGEIADLEAQRERQNREAEQLSSELSQIREQQASFSQSIATLSHDLEEREQRLTALQADKAQVEQELAQRHLYVEKLQAEQMAKLEQAQITAGTKEAQIQELKGSVAALQESVVTHQKSLESAQHSLQEEIRALTTQKTQVEDVLQAKVDKISELEAQSSQVTLRAINLSSELQKSKAAAHELQAELERRSASLQEATSGFQAKESALLSEQAQLSNKAHEMSLQIEQLRSDRSQLSEGLSQKEREAIALSSELHKRQQEVELLKSRQLSETETRDAQLDSLAEIIQRQKDQLSELQSSLSAAQEVTVSQKELLAQKGEHHERKAADLRSRLTEAQEQYARLKDGDYARGLRETEELQHRTASLAEQLKASRIACDEQSAQLEQLQSKLQEATLSLDQNAHQIEREREQHQSRLATQGESARALESELTALKERIAAQESENTELGASLAKARQSSEQQTLEMTTLSGQHASQLEQLNQVIEQNKADLSAAHDRLHLSEKAHLQLAQELEQSAAASSAQLEALSAQLLSSQALAAEREQLAASLQTQVEQLAASAASYGQQHLNDSTVLQTLGETVAQLQAELDAQKLVESTLREDLEAQAKAGEEKLGGAQAELQLVFEELATARASCKSVQQELEEMTSRRDALTAQVEGLSSQLALLSTAKEGAEGEREQAQNDRSELLVLYETSQSELESLNRGNAALKAELADLRKAIDEKTGELAAQGSASQIHLREIAEERDELRVLCDEQESKLAELAVLKSHSGELIESQKLELENLTEAGHAAGRRIAELEAGRNACLALEKQLHKEIGGLSLLLQEQAAAVESNEMALNELKANSSAAIQELKGNLEAQQRQAQSEIEELAAQKQEAEARGQSAEQRAAALVEQVTQLEAQVQRIQTASDEQVRARTEYIAKLEARLGEAQQSSSDAAGLQARSTEQEREQRKRQIEFESQLALVQSGLSTAEKEKQILREKIGQLESSAMRVEREREDALMEVRRLQEENQQMRALIQQQAAALQAAAEARPVFVPTAAIPMKSHRSLKELIKQVIPSSPSAAGERATKRSTMRGTTFLKMGYLYKQGGLRKNWLMRYFILESNRLVYFQTSSTEEALGSCALTMHCKVRAAEVDTRKPLSFCVENPSGRNYYLYAETEPERNEWMTALSAAVAALQTDHRINRESADHYLHTGGTSVPDLRYGRPST